MTEKGPEIIEVTGDPLHPQPTHDNLNIPISDRSPSELGMSTRSMRTSSFAMSDITDPYPQKLSQQSLESMRIRKAYSRPTPAWKTWRTTDTSIPKTENVDYFDEMDFRNTDRYIPVGECLLMRYGFLRVPSSNCEAPEVRNRAAVANGNGLAHSGTVRKKLLTKSKDDILIQPKKMNDVKMTTAKELERTKKWRDMAIIDRPSGTIRYIFPLSKKVSSYLIVFDSSWCNERSRGFLIVGELMCGTNFWMPKRQNSVIEKPNKSL